MKKQISIIPVLLLWLAIGTSLLSQVGCNTERPAADKDSTATDTTARITLLFAGDLMQHITQINAARTAGDTYDYTDCFALVRPLIEEADIAIGNFEVTLGGKPYRGYPCFSAPDEYVLAIRDAGFDVLLTANNHCLDSGRKGLERTIRMLDSLGIPHCGTYATPEARQKEYPLLIEKKGFRLALLNYTYGTNGLVVKAPNVVNYIDTAVIARDIVAAQAMQPDAIICCIHWGLEYQTLQNREQEQLADWLLAHGVTHIIGSHPHVVQPIEVRRTNDADRHLVVYSLGNYLSNMMKKNCDGGLMVTLELEKDSTTRMKDANYQLVWVSRPVVSHKKVHRLIPTSYPDSLLNAEERRLRHIFYESTREDLGKHNKGISERDS